jgi:lipopolysaccharide transport system ATP-binding protein
VLAVGDAAFQGKCLGKMDNVAKEGRTVLFVSHNMGMIQSLCDRAILLSAGKIADEGSPKDVISAYLNDFVRPETHYVAEPDSNIPFQILEVSSRNPAGELCRRFDLVDPIVIVVKYVVRNTLIGSAVTLKIFRNGIVLCTSFDTDGMEQLLEARRPGVYETRVTIPPMHLKAGRYSVNVGAGILNRGRINLAENAVTFDVDSSSVGDSLKSFSSRRDGLVIIPITWKMSLNGL